MGPNKVDVDLRDGSHPDLIKCSGQEGSEGASKSNGPTTGGASQCHAHLQHKDESEHPWNGCQRSTMNECAGWQRQGHSQLAVDTHLKGDPCLAPVNW